MQQMFLALALATVATPAAAQNWQLAVESEGDAVYVDQSRMIRDGNTIRFWYQIRHDEARKLSGGKVYDSSTVYAESDCREMSYISLQNSATYRGSSVLAPYDPDDGRRFATPGTVMEAVVAFACTGVRLP